MIRRSIIHILIFAFAVTQVVQAQSFFDSLYQVSTKDYHGFISKHAAKLYNKDGELREKYLEELKVLTNQSKMVGDSFFIYRILTEFVMDTANPGNIPDSDIEGIRELQENTLEFLVEQVKNDEISASSREFIIMQLGRIANYEFLPNPELNETAVNALCTVSESENLILHHTAIVSLKPIALKWTEKWKDMSEDAASHIIEDVGSSNTERQRIALIEAIDVLKKVEKGTDAVKSIWEGVAGAISDIGSPTIQNSVRAEMEKLVKANSGLMFKEQVEEVKEELNDLEEKKNHCHRPASGIIPKTCRRN